MGTSDSRWDEIKGTRYTLLPETTKIWRENVWNKESQDTGQRAKTVDDPWEAGNKWPTTTYGCPSVLPGDSLPKCNIITWKPGIANGLPKLRVQRLKFSRPITEEEQELQRVNPGDLQRVSRVSEYMGECLRPCKEAPKRTRRNDPWSS